METVDGKPRCVCSCGGTCPAPLPSEGHPATASRRCPRAAEYHWAWVDQFGNFVKGFDDWIELCPDCTASRRMSQVARKLEYRVHSLAGPGAS